MGRGSWEAAPALSKTIRGESDLCTPLNLAPPCPFSVMRQHVFIEHLLSARYCPGSLGYISENKQTNWHSTSIFHSIHFSWIPTPCPKLCTWNSRNLVWHLSNNEAVCKYDKIRKWILFGYHLSYLVMNWRWRRGMWKGYIRVPKQRRQNPMSCPAEMSGWPHCAGSVRPLPAGSGCSFCRSFRRSAPLPRWTWRHSVKTWFQNTQHRSRKILLDPESNSLKEKKQERKRNWLPCLLT